MKNLKKYKIDFDPTNEELGIQLVSFVETPAIKIKGVKLSLEKEFKFITQEDKMIVVAPALIPDLPIYRKDDDGEEYYVYFDKETIFKLMSDFNKKNKEYRFNYDHKENTAPAYVLESWIIEDEVYDKSKYYGFEGLPIGTWMLSAQVTDKDFWNNEIKAKGKFGFSIEGFLELKPVEFKEQLELRIIQNDVDSSNVASYRYNTNNNQLQIEFNDGSRYEYSQVDYREFEDIVLGDAACITEGENEFGSWFVGKTPSVGAAVYEFLVKANKPYRRFSSVSNHYDDLSDDTEMVLGIVEILNQIEDIENRKQIAINVMNDFESDGVIYDKNYFLKSIGLENILFEFQESYSDYPQAATDNACKVIEWKEKYPNEIQGMTQVGWIRANQLCKREPISEETISRMSAFIRHKDNSKISDEFTGTPWKDAGYVAYQGWGGDEGIAWAKRKLEEIRNKKDVQLTSYQKYLKKQNKMEKNELTVMQKYYINQKKKFVIEPEAGESEQEFVSRCVIKELENGYSQDQSLSICYNKYRNK
jgi:hypothetical protein